MYLYWLLLQLLVVHVLWLQQSNSISFRFPSTYSSYDRQLRNYIGIRCTGSSQSLSNDPLVWYYTGHLRNPLTGDEIAGIEGVEFVKLLGHGHGHSHSHSHSRATLQQANNGTAVDTRIQSQLRYLSKKIFIYTDASNHSEILRSFRVTPISPKRKVKFPMKEYHQIIHISPIPFRMTRFDKVKNSQKSTNHILSTEGDQHSIASTKVSEDSKSQYSVNVEWPGGRLSSTNKMIITVDNSSPKLKRYDITNFISGGTKPFVFEEEGGRRRGKSSHRRDKWLRALSRWISFQGPPSDLHGRSQEYYSIYEIPFKSSFSKFSLMFGSFFPKRQNINPKLLAKAGMVYRRYGESPSWYALRHSSTTELTGYALSSPTYIPDHVMRLINEVSPSFIDDNLAFETFDFENDLLERYRPWYQIINPFKKERIRKLRHNNY